jgi:hypothetical protein
MTAETYPCACCGDPLSGHHPLRSLQPGQLAFICDRCIGIIRLVSGMNVSMLHMSEEQARVMVMEYIDKLVKFRVVLQNRSAEFKSLGQTTGACRADRIDSRFGAADGFNEGRPT